MTKIRLYLDEDTMDNDLLEALRLPKVDVLSVQHNREHPNFSKILCSQSILLP